MKSNPSSPSLPDSVLSASHIEDWRSFFPALSQEVNNRPLIYLDNAATTLRPVQVVDAVSAYYTTINANVHRANHHLGHRSTETYEGTRKKTAAFIGAAKDTEIIFTRGTTESINFVAEVLGDTLLNEGDTVVLTQSEHHSNMLPWLRLKAKKGIHIAYIPVDNNGRVNMSEYEQLMERNPGVRLVSIGHASNLTGVVHPVHEMTRMAKSKGAMVLIDGAQAVAHHRVNVEEIGCDFYAFSAHKMYGPMGIGVLYMKDVWHEILPAYQFGGGMIDRVQFDGFSYADAPYKYEAGTPNVAGAAGLSAAIDFMCKTIDFDAAVSQEQSLLGYMLEEMKRISQVKIIGTGSVPHDPIVSFYVEGVHHYDIATMLDGYGVAVRAGHHCVQPLLEHWGLEGTVRASLSFYNTKAEVDAFLQALERVLLLLV